MKADQPKRISVFIASPGDLSPERKAFKDTIDKLNQGFGDGAGVEFVALGWEDENAEAGRRAQDVLNRRVNECDLFVLVLHRRWGQKAPDSPYSSYTEEEYSLAMDLWQKHKSPEVIVFFKNVDSDAIADPGPQLAQVLEFKKKLQNRHDTMYRSFNSEADFAKEMDKHLRSFARGEWKQLDESLEEIKLSPQIAKTLETAAQVNADQVQKAEVSNKNTAADLSLVKVAQRELALARAALDAVKNNRIEDARILFAQATEGTTDLSILSAAADFYSQVGDLDSAGKIVLRQASISRDRSVAADHYLRLVPQDLYASMSVELLDQMLAQYPPEVQEIIRAISSEVYAGGGMLNFMRQLLIQLYTTEELTQQAAYLASSVGQSVMRKSKDFLLACVQFGQEEFTRVLRMRHPEFFEEQVEVEQGQLAATPEQPQLGAGAPSDIQA